VLVLLCDRCSRGSRRVRQRSLSRGSGTSGHGVIPVVRVTSFVHTVDRFGLLVAGGAAAGGGELAEQPQQQQGFVRNAYLAGAGLAESGQQCQQIIARHQARLPRPWSDLRLE
jgi:hypothetical protein